MEVEIKPFITGRKKIEDDLTKALRRKFYIVYFKLF